jgi:hypothetical protein
MFTGVVSDAVIRTNLGWSLSAFVGLLLIFNITVILMANFEMLKRKFTLWKLKSASRKAQELKMKKILDEKKSK